MAIALSVTLSRNTRRQAAARESLAFLKAHFSSYPGSSEEIDQVLEACIKDVGLLLDQTLEHMRKEDDSDLLGWTRDLIESCYPGTTLLSQWPSPRYNEEGKALVVLLITRAVNADLDRQSEI